MSAKQCTKCIHDEMCKYKEKIEDIKEEHVFIEDITCNRFVNAQTISNQTQTASSKRTSSRGKKQEVVDEHEINEKTDAKIDETITESDNTTSDESNITDFNSLNVSNLYLTAQTVSVLNKNKIETVADVYTLNDSPDFKWSSVKGLKEHQYNELNSKLMAFNKPALVSFN